MFCFMCIVCKRWLKIGDKYYFIDDRIFCENDGGLVNKKDKGWECNKK